MGNLESKAASWYKTRTRGIGAQDLSQRVESKRPHSPLELNGVQQSDTLPHVGTIFPRRNPETPIRKSKSKKPASSDPDSATLSWEEITAKAKNLESKHKGKLPVLSREEEVLKFAERDKLRDDKAPGMEEFNAARVAELEARLQLHHIGLVLSFVEKYVGLADRDDLFQQAYFGLKLAIEKFEVKRGNRFGTYAKGKIRTEIMRVIRIHVPTLRVGVAEQASGRALVKTQERLTATLKRNPTMAELTTETGYPEERINELLSQKERLFWLRSLDLEDNNGRTLHEYISDPTDPSTEERALQFVDIELVEDILAHLAYLDPLGREVLKRRKGFRTGKPETLVSIAESLDLSQTEVWEIEKRVVHELSMLFNPKYAEAVTRRNEKAALMPELYPTFTEEQIVEAIPNERQRGFLRAFFIDKKTHDVIASQYDCSQSTVSRNIKAGIDRLTSLIDDVPPMILSA